MRKPVLIILVVAVLGILGAYAKDRQKNTATSTSNHSVTAVSGSANSSPAAKAAFYKDGTYIGSVTATEYGDVQVAVVISGDKITDIKFLQMPSDRGHTAEITAYSEPQLKQETLNAQSAKIDFISGATTTSYAYEQSLQAALDQAGGSAIYLISAPTNA
jgi:uncharacterized protein with FMN-binding domain